MDTNQGSEERGTITMKLVLTKQTVRTLRVQSAVRTGTNASSVCPNALPTVPCLNRTLGCPFRPNIGGAATYANICHLPNIGQGDDPP
jgi:hypothetical protein